MAVIHKSALVVMVLGLMGLSTETRVFAFGFEEVNQKAISLAAAPFQPLERNIPPEAAQMSYAVYQSIRFNKEKTIWKNTSLPYRLEMFYRAFLYPERIKINLIDRKGVTSEVPFTTDLFKLDSPEMSALPQTGTDYGFAGLKVYYKFPTTGDWREAIIFQGASYFRVPTKAFGLSLRGLAINTASSKQDEEFPAFTEFWVAEPKGGVLTVYALLDGPTVTGAYEFNVTPGAATVTEVKASLHFRKTPDRVGYAPLTSMFWYGENNYRKFPDYRPEVHDSDGLLIAEANGNRLWRPLQTVKNNLIDAFVLPKAPKGFGLLQRDRSYANAVDLEASYHHRPSAWVEPIGEGWDNGSVVLWQIPTVDEYHDNIVAYWMPDKTPQAGETHQLHYKVTCMDGEPKGLAKDGQAIASYITSSYGKKDRYFIMVDFNWGDKPPALYKEGKLPEMDLNAQGGAEIISQYVKPNPEANAWRLHAVVQFPSEQMNSVLRFRLKGPDGWHTEDWTYTFVPQE